MASMPRSAGPTWTRRLQGWSFLLFFVSLIVLTFVAVEAYNANDLVWSGYFAGLASVVPLLLVVLVYYGLPVWGISVPLAPDAVARALAAAADGRTVEPIADRSGPFARCVAVVHFRDPACTIGWSLEPSAARAGTAHETTVLVLRPESRDRRALADFRNRVARSLRESPPSSA